MYKLERYQASELNDVDSKYLSSSELKIGFLGLNIIGSGIVKNFIDFGYKIVLWSKRAKKCEEFEEAGAEVVSRPCDVIEKSDIIFSCVSGPAKVKKILFGHNGILSSESKWKGKGYVEMTGMDDVTSKDIADAIILKGGRYLEAQIQGSRLQAENGTLLILAAGAQSLFNECHECFNIIAKKAFFLGDIGNATKINLILQMIYGLNIAVLAESMALASRAELPQTDLLELLSNTKIVSPMILEKGIDISNGDYTVHHQLKHIQKGLMRALTMSEKLEQPLPLAATANELYKRAKQSGYSSYDSSAVYILTSL